MTNPTIAAGFPHALLDFAVSRGADREQLLVRAQIRPEELVDQNNRIPLASYAALMQAAIELCNEPALALHFGATVQMQERSIVELIGATAETVGEAYLQLQRFARLNVDDAAGRASVLFQHVHDQEGLWLELTSPIYRANRHFTESSLARTICGARRTLGSYFGNRPFPGAIHFTHAQPSYRAEYDRIFNVPLTFGSDKNAFLIDEALLATRLPPSNRYVFGVLSERAEALLASLEGSTSTRGRVESLLMRSLHTGAASMDLIAGKLAVSRQTLYRQLKAEGVTFEQVLDELRHKMALHYLSDKQVSVNETCYLVGFADPAAFSRAFKRWTGASPRALRAAKIAGDP